MKTIDRVLIKDSIAAGKAIISEEATDGISDIVRYTVASTADTLTEDFEAFKSALEAKGYKPVKIKNTWDTFSKQNAYRGVNTVFMSPDGQKFELQFHTPESFDVKERQHGLYEEQRSPDTPAARKQELTDIMYGNAEHMTRPKGVERIIPYPPKKDK